MVGSFCYRFPVRGGRHGMKFGYPYRYNLLLERRVVRIIHQL